MFIYFTAAGNLATISSKKRVGRPKHHWAPNTVQSLVKHIHIENNTLSACLPSSYLKSNDKHTQHVGIC